MAKIETKNALPSMSEKALGFIGLIGNISDNEAVEPINWLALEKLSAIETLVAASQDESIDTDDVIEGFWDHAKKLDARENKSWGGSYPDLLLWTCHDAALENMISEYDWGRILSLAYSDGVFDALEPYEQFEILDHHHSAWDDSDDLPEIYEELNSEFGENADVNEAA